ncbi:RNA polymerase sigma factor [Gorillibacterium timonense]|uniref:RNA polymerase sigma factor n=1 Tax=Gorillibacterium timonense TaxID=1689269 RepID=UPI00071D46BB|nr:sigma-70 family RNA polymerase sigma factor [Gorillibacterium timonense]
MHVETSRPDERFSEKYEAYGTMLFRIAMVYLGNRADAEEAVQDTFLKLLYKAPAFHDPGHEKAWLIRVITNHCKTLRSSLWSRRVDKRENLDHYEGSAADRQVLEQVMQLPFRYKTVVYLHYYEDYPVKEIADMLKIGVSAVKMRLKRGRELLRLELEEEDL